MDVNNDGLVDIVNNGSVYFNYLVNGVPHFTTNSKLTSMPMNKKTVYDDSEPAQGIIRYNNKEDIEAEARANYLQDIVRVWQAPYSGTVQITGDIRLLEPAGTYDADAYANADGVRVAIQNDKAEIWSSYIKKGQNSPVPVSLNNITIEKDKLLLFRVQSGDSLTCDGNFDNV
ncbi:MAG: hypothetical protein QM751_13600 [Paludibacteraceae bacterium]